MQDQLSLVPVPQQVEVQAGQFLLPKQPLLFIADMPHQIYCTGLYLARALEGLGAAPTLTAAGAGEPCITLRLNQSLLPQPQSYRIVIDRTGITLTGGDEAGLFYSVCTLVQLMRISRRGDEIQLPYARILDWPDFPHRGILLDITRDKVPTMETLFELVELLASLKINQLQFYTEHAFAYRGHEEVWKDASPLTGDEILALDAHCQAYFIELVPNQNSFGHMHRWLKHETYRHLAEVPDGWLHPFREEREPYGLCPLHSGSLELLADLYDQLLPHFSSRQFNACLDETFDLGMGQSKEVCEERGTERVYLDFVLKVYDLVKRRGRTLQFWGDIIIKRPELIAELPKDSILLEWGYEANHPFAEHGKRFADAGLSFYVCPGTSSWNTLAGRTENALGNLRNAAISGRQHGAIGYLNTDWGDYGHMQPLPVSYLSYLAGAAYSWNVASAEDETALDIPLLLDQHIFLDEARVMGRLAYDLGNTYRETGQMPSNSSILFWQFILPNIDLEAMRAQSNLWSTQYIERLEQMSAQANFDVIGEYVDEVMTNLDQAKMARPDAETIRDEFHWVANMLQFAAKLGQARAQNGSTTQVSGLTVELRQILVDELRPLIERHREVWLARNRLGGQSDSTRLPRKLLDQLSV
jgi:hexosaminidase